MINGRAVEQLSKSHRRADHMAQLGRPLATKPVEGEKLQIFIRLS